MDFEKWFKEQFRYHPDDFRPESEIKAELVAAKNKVDELQRELDLRTRCTIEYKTARYAYNLKDKE